MSPVFSGYCHTGADDEVIAPAPAPQSAGYINTFGRETLIDPALTSALQAPVKVMVGKSGKHHYLRSGLCYICAGAPQLRPSRDRFSVSLLQVRRVWKGCNILPTSVSWLSWFVCTVVGNQAQEEAGSS